MQPDPNRIPNPNARRYARRAARAKHLQERQDAAEKREAWRIAHTCLACGMVGGGVVDSRCADPGPCVKRCIAKMTNDDLRQFGRRPKRKRRKAKRAA